MFDRMRRAEKARQFLFDTLWDYGECGMLAPPCPAQVALDAIIEHLLGENWYVPYSCNVEQTNTEAVCVIIEEYKRKSKYNS